MIESRKDLKDYIAADRRRMPIAHPVLSFLTFSENWCIRRYLTILRYLEYHQNKYVVERKKVKGLRINQFFYYVISGGVIFYFYEALCYVFFFLLWRRQCLKTGIQVYPNTCGPGLAITHKSFVHIDNLTTIGVNCSILPMVLFGKNRKGKIVVGDNVTFGCGVTVLAPCHIGCNVYVGAGSVVNRDIPDNCIVAGVPAKIIKRKE